MKHLLLLVLNANTIRLGTAAIPPRGSIPTAYARGEFATRMFVETPKVDPPG